MKTTKHFFLHSWWRLFYIHVEDWRIFRLSLNLLEFNIYLKYELKINAFWDSSNWPQYRETLTKDKSDRFNKSLLTELRSFKRDVLALL